MKGLTVTLINSVKSKIIKGEYPTAQYANGENYWDKVTLVSCDLL